MSTNLKQIERQLAEIRELLGERSARKDDLVTAGYIARRTELSARTIAAGKAGTKAIPRVYLKDDHAKGKGPGLLRFPRGAADKWIADKAREAVADTTSERILQFENRRRRA